MENSKSALDAFINSQPESVSLNISPNGPSYLSLIKSRYAANVQPAENPKVRIAYDAWHEDFVSSNNVEITSCEVDGPPPCCGSHPHINDDEDLEHITLMLDSISTQLVTESRQIIANLKVDNFYIDGENDDESMDFGGYIPSGVNSSTVEVELSELEPSAGRGFDTQIEALTDILQVDDLEDDFQDSSDNLPVKVYSPDSAPNMTHLQRAYLAEQNRHIETLSCSEEDEAEHEKEEECPETEEGSGDAMADALAAFQKFSPRYRDISTGDLIPELRAGNMPTNENSAVEVTRWYDDVEEFVEV